MVLRKNAILSLLVKLCLIMIWPTLCFANTAVVIKNGRAIVYDTSSNTTRCYIGHSGVLSASTDGVTAVILYDNGRVVEYKVRTCATKGYVGHSGAIAAQVSDGIVTITYNDGTVKTYRAR